MKLNYGAYVELDKDFLRRHALSINMAGKGKRQHVGYGLHSICKIELGSHPNKAVNNRVTCKRCIKELLKRKYVSEEDVKYDHPCAETETGRQT